ncbi:di-trans,poly-cis-decaprenylcistransferas-like protein [Lophiostoma macrostomum CBS 122681]|uniref:ditrans,polycis-polyprenyl diphosphate synthase [(2E,6E)-farnesyldiphosphate specific] n=1 Tax=Lophiostoma macrostomum CBS 122681 TaxID=1314788 RepID=A0A6A6TV18_9PLEO|nr:di-trans,poly-cis-decaprenylcistransferas-like protein [Lophiostoma macrostomum CBS 122681]
MASTGVGLKETTAFRRGIVNGKQLTAKDREALMQAYLPLEPADSSDPSRSSSPAPRKKQNMRTKPTPTKRKVGIVRNALHVVIYVVVSFLFSVFFRFRRSWRLVTSKIVSLLKYHHRTPEFIQRDTKHLERLPQHLSVILDFHESDEDLGNAGLEGLVNDVCEIAAWTASAGIPFLSVYERTGKLKNYIQQTHSSISQTLEAYFGPRRKPSLSVRAPHLQSYSPPLTPPTRPVSSDSNGASAEPQHLTVLLLSAEDGRDTMIDLTKTLSDMAQNGTLHPEQVNSNLIDAELREAVCTDPDLLVLFSPTVVLNGYPPWQLRLTEIFHLPDNKGVNYQVFLRSLYNYAKVEMRLGR